VDGDTAIRSYPSNRIPIFTVIAATALAVDLITKEVVFARLGLFGHTRWLIDSWVRFELHTNLNHGALWGMGQGFAPVFAGISVCAFAAIIFWLFIRNAASSLWLTIALALVSGGTLGNLYDRMGLHKISLPNQDQPALAVRDFLHFQFGGFDWAIFNVADICLVVGAIMLLIQSFRHQDEPVQEGRPATEAA
jgi:signal peptidase II